VSGTEQERGRQELVSGLSKRFVELRKKAGLTQQGVADAMGKSRARKMPAGRLERGGVENASLLTVAEYLRAVRAGFGDLKGVLDRYTSLPIPEPVRKLAEVAPLPRLQVRGRALVNRPDRSYGTYSEPRAPNPEEELRVLRIRQRAGYWVLRRAFERYLHGYLDAAEVPATHWLRRRMASYARRVFNGLFRTRGPKEPKRRERLARLREAALKLPLPDALAEFVEYVVKLVFDDMAAHDELDWMPPPEEAFTIMAVKPKHRVVTDAQMCLAEWADVSSRYNAALMEIYERPHKAAFDVAESARCDAHTLNRYQAAALRAANIARTTMPDTPRRKKSVDDWHATDWPEELDRRLLERMLAAALAIWDALLPTLPPAPGPMPV
jgi:transcriptional regulator with XRE-family HTH domain